MTLNDAVLYLFCENPAPSYFTMLIKQYRISKGTLTLCVCVCFSAWIILKCDLQVVVQKRPRALWLMEPDSARVESVLYLHRCARPSNEMTHNTHQVGVGLYAED